MTEKLLEQKNKIVEDLNHDLEKNIIKLETVNKELEAFSYSVSHDLRAPLRSIAGYAQILKEDYHQKLDEEGNTMLNNILKNGTMMGNLIDGLLSFSRLGKVELIKHKLEMAESVKMALNELSEGSMPPNIEIEVKKLIPAFADSLLIRQVWINLISNAIKYSSKKSSPKIEIGSYMNENDNIYYVRDNGSGFDMQYIHKLFGVFQRLHKTKEFEGTGVGLAIVHKIVSRHGGKVWAEGKVNEGATFYFSLPVM